MALGGPDPALAADEGGAAAAADPARSGWPLIIGVAVAALTFLRVAVSVDPGSQVWAEDGLFLSCATGPNPITCLFEPYAGYLHTLPRALEAIVALFPPSVAGLVMLVLASLATGVVALLVTSRASRAGLPVWACGIAGVATALMPDFGSEAVGNLSNLQWVFMYGVLWAVLPYWGRITTRAAIVDSLFVFVAVVSAPGTLALAPLVVARLVTRRDVGRAERIRYLTAPATLATGIVLQLLVYVTSPKEILHEYQPWEWARFNYFGGLLRSVTFGNFHEPPSLWWSIAAILLIVAGLAALFHPRADRRLRAAGSLVLVCTVLAFGLTIAFRPPTPPRYWVAPGLMFFAFLLIVCCVLVRLSRGWIPVAVIAGAGLAVAWAFAFPMGGARTSAPARPWQLEVAHAKALCVANPELSSAPVQVSPKFLQPIQFPCAYLTK